MIPSVSVSSETVASGIGKRDLGAVVLIALDAVLRHLSHERLLSVWTAPTLLPIDEEGQGTVEPSAGTSVLLGGFPSRRCILQDRVETSVSRHLRYPLAETRSQGAAG
jgi:hypothetical protein